MDWFLYSTLLKALVQLAGFTPALFAVLSNIHTLTDALGSNLGSVSCPRIFGLQAGAVGDRTTNQRVADDLLHLLSYSHAPTSLSSVEVELLINGHFLHLVLLLDVTF